MDNSFSLGGREFKLSKLNAFKQFHVVRRIAPILSDLLPALADAKKLLNPDQLPESEKLEAIAKFAGPIIAGFSKLSDADSEFVLYGLLSSVEVKQPAGNWAYVVSGNMLMMQDLELPFLIQLAGRAFMYNLSGFFAALPQK